MRLLAALAALAIAAFCDAHGPVSLRLTEAFVLAGLVIFAGSPCRQRPVIGSELGGR